MKNLTISLFVLIFSLSIAVSSVMAQEEKGNYRNEELVSVSQDEVINGDFFAFGETVEISGTVNGDVYTAAGNVLVDGTINGDLIAGGGSVSISGTVVHDVRVAGGQVTINGEIGRNLTVTGGNVEITNGAEVRGSILAGAGNLNIAASVGKDIRVGTGSLTISDRVGGDVVAGVGVIRLTSRANIEGDLTYWSDSDASIDESAVVAGEITRNIPSQVSKPSAEKVAGVFTGFNIFAAFVGLISTFVIGLVLIHFLPNINRSVVHTLKKKPWPSLGIGVLTLIAAPFVIGFLFITIVGIPLALIGMVLYLISLYLARIFVIFWLGTTIFERSGRKSHNVWALITGLVIYYILTLIPIVGPIVTLFALLFGLGAAIITKKELYLTARKKDLV